MTVTPADVKVENEEDKRLRCYHFKQISYGLTITLGQTVLSFLIASTSFLPQIIKESTGEVYTVEDVKWIASGPILGIILGCIVCYLVLQRLGPASILRAYFAVSLFVYLLMAWVKSPQMLLIARLVLFFMFGLYDVVGVPLVVELCEPRVRSICGVFPELLTSSGIMFAYITFSFLSGTAAILCNAIPIFLGLVGSFFLPESPYWLVSRGEEAKAEQSLGALLGRGRPEKVRRILDQTLKSFRSNDGNSIKSQIRELKHRQNWKPLLIIVAIFGFRELCGTNFILYYALPVFEDAHVPVNVFICTIAVGGMRLLSSLLSCVLQYKFNRRLVMLTSLFVSGWCLTAAGIVLYFDLPHLKVLPLVNIFAFILMNGFGMGSMPFLFLGELLPKRVKSLGTGIVFSFFSLYQFGIVIVSPIFIQHFHVGIALICFAAFNFFSLIIIYYILPETRGKSFAELETLFK